MDLRCGYWQVSLSPTDKPKIAFISYDGLYHFNVMRFELCNAPATFESMMDVLLRGHWSIRIGYLDDIMIFSPTFEKHISLLCTVLECIRNA